MYLDHFGLSEPPFRITPHTDFFFEGANRGATLDALIYAITHDEGIVKVSGEVGSGKTMLCRVLMERLPDHVDIIYLANPSLSREDILYAIADELDLDLAEKTRASAVLRALQDQLISRYGQGRQVVVLIDEAHAMPKETLEEIRLLSNLESNRHKLLQLVLFGQPELNDILARPDMRQLKERITHNFTLEPLVRADIAHYLDFRMRAAGYRGPEIFSPPAVKLIAGASEGLTRRINILADKALLAAFAENSHQITPKQVRAAIRDAELTSPRQRLSTPAMAVAGIVAIVAAAALAWQMMSATLPAPAPSPAAALQPATPPPSESVADTTAPRTIDPSPPPVALTEETEPAPDADLGPLTRERMSETRRWLATAPDDQWFIQLLATDARRSDYAEAFVAKAVRLLGQDQVRVYTADRNGEPRLGVIFGQFANREAASGAVGQLPADLRSYKPFPRQVRRLR
jgi:type II secretory pathway predicted ATPase ExeA